MKSGNLNFMESSGLLQACNWTALPLFDQKMQNYLKTLSHSYMFRQYGVILRELVINTFSSHTSISKAVVGNTV
jgi:hypothetical protein